MKVAVITLKDSPNYGCMLQTYALQKAIEKLGYGCDLIDYMNDGLRHKFAFFGKPRGMSNVYWLFKKVQYPLMVVMMKKILPFYGHMNLTRRFDNRADLVRLNKEYDIFLTGSDQVWACDLNYFDDSYFLGFVDEDHKKISYAASFGRTVDMLTETEKSFIAPQLDRFESLGVREASGSEVVKLLCGRMDAVPVIDPTFLLDRDDWERVASHNHRGKGKKYILCYLVQSRKNDTEALKFAKAMSRKTGMPIIKICRGLTSVIWGETTYVPTVEEWLGLFMDAQYIITNSFHGMAYSVNFKKDFTSFIEGNPASGRNSRVYERCEDFGLSNRIHLVNSRNRPKASHIDYGKVEPSLKRYIDDSKEWLQKALCSI